MRKNICLLALLLSMFSSPIFSETTENLEDVRKQTEDLYRTGSGSTDSTFSVVAKAMTISGITGAVLIAILASAIHQSSSSHDDSSCSH